MSSLSADRVYTFLAQNSDILIFLHNRVNDQQFLTRSLKFQWILLTKKHYLFLHFLKMFLREKEPQLDCFFSQAWISTSKDQTMLLNYNRLVLSHSLPTSDSR